MSEWVVETSELTCRYGQLLAVDQVNLRVPRAGVYGFLGPNGAGKTTTIRMLLGLIRPVAGEVRLFGARLGEERRAVMRRVGALVETPSLYPHLTGFENLEVTRRLLGARRELIGRALAIVKLEDAARRKVREYSLGMRQRLGLALALLTEPELLILDEPANGLDPAGIYEMRELIRRLPIEHGTTVFLSSHLLGEVEQMANHIGIIHAGRLLFQGTLADLHAQRQLHLTIGVNQPAEAARHLGEAGWKTQMLDAERLLVATQQQMDAVQINRLLVNRHIEVFHLAMQQASLEDIFLTLTNGEGAARRSQ